MFRESAKDLPPPARPRFPAGDQPSGRHALPIFFLTCSLVKELLADVVGSKIVVFEFVIGVNDQNAAVMDGGHQCSLVFEFVGELETSNDLADNFVSISRSRSHSPIKETRRLSTEDLNFERIIDLLNMDFGDTTGGGIGVRPFPDQRRQVKFSGTPMSRLDPAIIVKIDGILSICHRMINSFAR